MTHPSRLQVNHVSLNAPTSTQQLLKDISFAVQAGDRLGVTGASGAGKSSLLRLLNRLSDPSEGSILLEGQDIRQIPPLHLRRQVVLVPQESKLLGMTVGDALTYPLKLRNLDRTEIQQRRARWIEHLRIPSDWLDRTEVQLSVGQRQLVAIARGLVTQPKVLLLDEPTSALDTGRSGHLIEPLTALATSCSTAIIMVNHDLDIIRQFCDRLIHLHQGQIVQHQAADQVDWQGLQDTISQVEQAEALEWGDDEDF